MNFLSLAVLLPEFTLAVAAMSLLLAGAFIGDRATKAILNMAILVLFMTAVAVAGVQWGMGGEARLLSPGGFTEVSAFTTFIKILILAGGSLALLLAYGYLSREEMLRIEYPVLILLAVVGMMLMVSSHNLLMMYVGLEMQSLCLYVLAAFRRDATRSTEAGLKYFVLGALASGFLLYGISLVYGFTGSLDFSAISDVLKGGGGNHLANAGMLFILAALAFKVSAAPFHMWTPDVYEGSPTPVTAFLSTVPKLAAMGLLIKVLYGPFSSLLAGWQPVVAVLALLSMLVGALGAIGQNNIKRLLAYGSIGHVGFALIGLAANRPDTVLIYLVFYMIMSLGAFAVVLLMCRDGRMLEEIDELAGISRLHPYLAGSMAVLMLSMAGIPPLVGFFTKLYVFVAAVEAGMVWLALAGAVASVVGAYYYLRIIKIMYFDEPVVGFDVCRESGLTGALGAMIVFTLAGLLFISPVAILAQASLHAVAHP